MGFLEAMNLGLCVISPDFPTMNEYIKHQKNGILFDIFNPKKLDISNSIRLGQKANKTIKKGYKKYKRKQKQIIEFNQKPIKLSGIKSYKKICDEELKMDILYRYNFQYLNERYYIMNNIRNILSQFLSIEPNTVLYGAGTVSKFYLPYIKDKVAFIVDTNESLWGRELFGIEIISPQKLKEIDFVKIIITVINKERQIISFLQHDLGIDTSKIEVLKIKDFIS
jgi:hypothetical protein